MKRTNQLKPIIYGLGFAIALLSVALFPTACNNAPQAEEPNATEEIAEATVHKATDPLMRGQELFVSYCAICHGENGNGPMAELLKVEPPDLTLIAARRNGNFPANDIKLIIDGTTKLKGHGSSDMPVWGATFRASEKLETEEEISAEIDKIVKYLESIQKQAEPQDG